MKKFIILLLLIPLALMARPRRDYISNKSELVAFVGWRQTANCQWSNSSGSIDFAADADCDDKTRICYGAKNATDCSIGATDGQYPRIVLKNLKKGLYYIKWHGGMEHTNTTAACGWTFKNETDTVFYGEFYNDTVANSSLQSHQSFFELTNFKPTLQLVLRSYDQSTSGCAAICSAQTYFTSDDVTAKCGLTVIYYPSGINPDYNIIR